MAGRGRGRYGDSNRVPTHLNLTRECKDRLERMAEESYRSQSNLIEMLIDAAWRSRKQLELALTVPPDWEEKAQ